MNTLRTGFATLLCVGALISVASSASAQDDSAKPDPSTQEQTDFAPGVVTVIPAAPRPEETVSPKADASADDQVPPTLSLKSFLDSHPELAWDADHFTDGTPHFDPRSRTLVKMAEQINLRREIYCFEFSFKPLRHMYIDVPVGNGGVQRKLVWYMVYRVRYRGGDMRPAADDIGGKKLYQRIESISYDSRRFFPLATLKDHVSGREYLDRILPSAKQRIQYREEITAPLYDSVEITRIDVPRSTDESAPGVWGVLTWIDVNPHIDFLSVYVSGLTNAFEQDGEGKDAPFRRKVLQLNFFRPGDAMSQTEDEIRFGVPAFSDSEEQEYVLGQYRLPERLDYRWIFKPLK